MIVLIALAAIACVLCFMYGFFCGTEELDNSMNWGTGYDMGFEAGKEIGIQIGLAKAREKTIGELTGEENLQDRCEPCDHYHSEDEYDWCHECMMEYDHFKPKEPGDEK